VIGVDVLVAVFVLIGIVPAIVGDFKHLFGERVSLGLARAYWSRNSPCRASQRKTVDLSGICSSAQTPQAGYGLPSPAKVPPSGPDYR
jgi:hypothetical protein